MKQYRFFYHYNKPKKVLTVHFRNTCYITKNVDCLVPAHSKWNKSQPNLVMQGKAEKVTIIGDWAVIE